MIVSMMMRDEIVRRSPTSSETPPNFPPILRWLEANRSRSDSPLAICIVTREFFGPFKNGGIGTAYTHLAHLLVAAGHSVTIFFTTPSSISKTELQRWRDYYLGFGIEFVAAEPPTPPSAGGQNSATMQTARLAYEWLKERTFDVVHVSEYLGDAYFALVAKRLGLAFQKTTFVIKTSSPTLWCHLGNDKAVVDLPSVMTMYIERMSVELADIVVSPSQHMLRWMTNFGYTLPPSSYVQPNLLVPDKTTPLAPFPIEGVVQRVRERMEVKELVFFGRLEWRKGLAVFCNAVGRLDRAGLLEDVSVTFLGKGTKDTLAYVQRQAKRWSFNPNIVDSFDSEQAVEYLKSRGRLACIPSLVENSAFTIYEGLLNGFPFIASDTGGNPELVHPNDRSDVIFHTDDPGALVTFLMRVLANGAVQPRPSFSFSQSRETWLEFHRALAAKAQRRSSIESKPLSERASEHPLVSICMAHYNRPTELSQALDSLRGLTYPNFEVILTDDGSTDPAAIEYLSSLNEEFAERGWKILYQDNKYLGAARNNSASHARGEYLLFMDDDNIAKQNELDVFVACALHSAADILTCFSDVFSGPSPESNSIQRETPIGADLGAGIVKNVFGDANAMMRKSVFEDLGGFCEDYATGTQDYELFLKAILKGYNLQVVPEALFWYRVGHPRMNTEPDTMERGRLRAFRQVFEAVPRPLHIPLRLAQGAAMELANLRGKYARLQAATRQLKTEFERLEASLGLGKRR
jgi:O-antigen biosynthesis protein